MRKWLKITRNKTQNHHNQNRNVLGHLYKVVVDKVAGGTVVEGKVAVDKVAVEGRVDKVDDADDDDDDQILADHLSSALI